MTVDFSHMFGEKFAAKHGDPDFVFIQPWIPNCWVGSCDEPSTRVFGAFFPTTVFVQGVCEKHAERIQTKMKALDFELVEGDDWIFGRNQKEIDAMWEIGLSKGGIEPFDASWDVKFPSDWLRYAIDVGVKRLEHSCWYKGCKLPTRVSMFVWKVPSGVARKGRFLSSADDVGKRFVVRVCEGHQGGVQRDLQEAGFSRYAKRTGGLGFQNPKCVLPPFGSVDWRPDDPDDGLPLPEPKENVA